MSKKQITDHKGHTFDSIKEMCRFWHISENRYYNEKKRGQSLQNILENKTRKTYIDPEGNIFYNQADLAAHWGIKEATLSRRLHNGMSIAEALKPVSEPVQDHLGNTFKNKCQMCSHYNITPSTYDRRLKNGWTLEKTLTSPSITKRSFTDHKGNTFKSFGAMCRHWGIPDSTVQNRLYKLGYDIERALTEPTKTQHTIGKTCHDHLGNIYESKATMCCKYGIPRNVFHRRIKEGWSLEKALTTPPSRKNGQGRVIYDHKGNPYSSVAEMCNAYHIDFAMYGSRIRMGWSLEKALTTPPEIVTIGKKECVDHLGNHFKSQAEMMRHWGVTKDQLRSRIELGWTLEQILTTPKRIPHKHPCKDHLGNEWDSLDAMLSHYGVASTIFKRRLNVMHLSLEEALTGRSLHNVSCTDHLGNQFNTVEDFCIYWNLPTNMYHYRTKKLKWPIEKTATYIATQKELAGIQVKKQLNDHYCLILIDQKEYTCDNNQVHDLIRKYKVLQKLQDDDSDYKIKHQDTDYLCVEHEQKEYMMSYNDLFKILFLKNTRP